MIKTLYSKLAVVLIGVLAILGLGYLSLTVQTVRMHQQEVRQELNRTLAENLAAKKPLFIDGTIDEAAIHALFEFYMVVNPAIENYIIDREGTILSYSAPPGKVKRTSISLEPIRQLLDDTHALPILGDDPRDPAGQKVFSAASIVVDGKQEGYLYVVLGGEEYESIASLLQGSYMFRLSTWVIIASLLVGSIAGLMLFNLITRRLTKLSAAMKNFHAEDSMHPSAFAEIDTTSKDEIGQLGASFKVMAERIAKQMRELEQTDALRRELVANVSHDLRTPIASLQGYIETLLLKRDHLSEDEQRQYLEIAMKHSLTLASLVDQLFELAKLDAQIAPVHQEPFAMGDLVQDIIVKFQLTAEVAEIQIQHNFPRDLPLVTGDIALIERVLENLIENAIRHTPKSGTVAITLQRDGNSVATTVGDNGCGIPESALPRIFDRFYQVDNTRTTSAGHGGLGLAIVKRILDLHQQPIQVESQPNRGTTFQFTLHVAPV